MAPIDPPCMARTDALFSRGALGAEEGSAATRRDGSSVVILSGGMDSAVCLAIAKRSITVSNARQRPGLIALSFDYGQRHALELDRAAKLASHYGAEHLLVRLDTRPWGGSALTDPELELPPFSASRSGIPVTYVPARNTIFLSVALGVAEARGCDDIYIGVNAIDYSGYPDCRSEFLEAFSRVAELGQKRGIEGDPVRIRAPLIELTKAEIVSLGTSLKVPFELTWSCYRGGPKPCGRCDACVLRAKGFAEAGKTDPGLVDPSGS